MPTAPENNPKEREPTHFFGMVLKNSAVAAALLYFLGWVYLHRYFLAFEIEIAQLDLGWNDVLIYSTILVRHVINRFLFQWPTVLLSLVVVVLGLYVGSKSEAITSWFTATLGDFNTRYILPAMAAMLLIYVAINLAQSVADERASRTKQTGADPATVIFKPTCTFEKDSWLALRASDLKMERLFATSKSQFFYVHTGGVDRQQNIMGRMVQIPADCIQAITVRLR